MDWEFYAKELEKIIGAVTVPEHTRITVDAFVEQARKKAEGGQDAGTNPHWIPVEERLPKRMNEKSRFSETVLVYNKEGYKDAAYYDYEEKIWRWMPMVTHWMPIVPPRKEE